MANTEVRQVWVAYVDYCPIAYCETRKEANAAILAWSRDIELAIPHIDRCAYCNYAGRIGASLEIRHLSTRSVIACVDKTACDERYWVNERASDDGE